MGADQSVYRNDTFDYYQKLHGCKDASIEALVWASSRLFSSGLHGEITEWDLNKLTAKVCWIVLFLCVKFVLVAHNITCSLDMC